MARASKDARVTSTTIEFSRGLVDFRFLDGSARATLEMDDGTRQTFDWCHDELSYVVADFNGKTRDEIRAMHHERDMKYLRS